MRALLLAWVNYQSRWHRLFCSCILSLTLTTTATADVFSEIFVFGDSLSDTGNVSAWTWGYVPPDPPYFDGRFSNGPLWPEYLADQLGLIVVPNGPDPTVIRGNNFAFGGARAARNVSIFLLGELPSVEHQVTSFVNAAGTVPSDALYTVWCGGNDLRFAVKPARALTFEERDLVVQDAVAGIVRAVAALAEAGAQDILVPNIPDLGATPEAVHRGNVGEATVISVQFNILLAAELDAEASELGINIIQFDSFALLRDIVQDALDNEGRRYGITNIDTPIAPGLPGQPRSAEAAEDPDVALWADDVHPSQAAHAVLAEAVLQELVMDDPMDLDGDGTDGAVDLTMITDSWGSCTGCPADLNRDGAVGTADLNVLLGRRRGYHPGTEYRFISLDAGAPNRTGLVRDW